MGNFGLSEMLVIAVVALLVFGPERLPDLARQAGKAIARFRSETSRSIEELKRAADLEDLDRELRSMGKDLRDVRSSMGRALLEPSGPRDETRPPPMDPEAT